MAVRYVKWGVKGAYTVPGFPPRIKCIWIINAFQKMGASGDARRSGATLFLDSPQIGACGWMVPLTGPSSSIFYCSRRGDRSHLRKPLWEEILTSNIGAVAVSPATAPDPFEGIQIENGLIFSSLLW